MTRRPSDARPTILCHHAIACRRSRRQGTNLAVRGALPSVMADDPVARNTLVAPDAVVPETTLLALPPHPYSMIEILLRG